MTPLAVDYEIGRTHDNRGRALLQDFAAMNGWGVVQGPLKEPAPIDAVLVKDGFLVAVVETRTRITHTLKDIERMGNTYLITHQKLLDLMEGGRLFGVPSFLVVQLACGARFGWCIGDRNGDAKFTWEVDWTQTRATSLDERQTMRANAYIPMDRGMQWNNKSTEEIK